MNRIRPPVPEPEYYFRDDFGKTFYSSTAKIFEALLELNIVMNNTSWGTGGACLNDFYSLLELKPTAKGSFLMWDSCYLFEDYDKSWVDIYFEEKYIGSELTYLLHYDPEPSMEYLHPRD